MLLARFISRIFSFIYTTESYIQCRYYQNFKENEPEIGQRVLACIASEIYHRNTSVLIKHSDSYCYRVDVSRIFHGLSLVEFDEYHPIKQMHSSSFIGKTNSTHLEVTSFLFHLETLPAWTCIYYRYILC